MPHLYARKHAAKRAEAQVLQPLRRTAYQYDGALQSGVGTSLEQLPCRQVLCAHFGAIVHPEFAVTIGRKSDTADADLGDVTA